MSDKTEADYQQHIRSLESLVEQAKGREKRAFEDRDVMADKLQRVEARIEHANDTLMVARAVNDEAALRIAKLELWLAGERSKNRTVAIQMELLVATNLSLRERLQKHEQVDPPEQALKPLSRELAKLENMPGSSDYYFDKDQQAQDHLIRRPINAEGPKKKA